MPTVVSLTVIAYDQQRRAEQARFCSSANIFNALKSRGAVFDYRYHFRSSVLFRHHRYEAKPLAYDTLPR